MGTANDHIRVSDDVKRKLDRRRREGESYNEVLTRVLEETETGDFYDGFGQWTDEEAERVREQRQRAKEERKERMRRLSEDDG